MNTKTKTTNAQKNAAYPVTAAYLAWQAECVRQLGECTFTASNANHRFANPIVKKGIAFGHFWLNNDRGAINGADGDVTWSTPR